MTQYGFYFDSSRCTGCHTCEMACKDYHDLPQTASFRKVCDVEGGVTQAGEDGAVVTSAYAYHVSAACNHCDNPGCIAATGGDGTIVKDEQTGLVLIVDPAGIADPELVVSTCPYGVPYIDEATGLVMKCDGCYSRVIEGKQPVCVEACPLRALEFGDVEELAAAHPEVAASIAPLPGPELTGPNTCFGLCPAAELAAADAFVVTNTKTLEGVPAWA